MIHKNSRLQGLKSIIIRVMSHVNVWIHYVWSTKNRTPLLYDEVRSDVFEHMRVNAREKGVHLDHIGGYRDHVHCLVSMAARQMLDVVAQQLKGESSRWINQNSLCKSKFGWQDGYFAESVGIKSLNAVREYIRNQEQHHQKRSFLEEWQMLQRRSGIWK